MLSPAVDILFRNFRAHRRYLPDGEVVVGRELEDQRAHRDPDVALRDAFAAAERLLRARD